MTKRIDPSKVTTTNRTDSNGNRICTGSCGLSLSATEDNFYFRKAKNGVYYPSSLCRSCEKKKAAEARKNRYASTEGKEVISFQNKNWRDSHPEYAEAKRIKQNARYANDVAFRESRKEAARQWRITYPEKKRSANAFWHQQTKHRTRRKASLFATFFPDLKLRNNLRIAICESMKQSGGSKNGRSILSHLPYSIVELKSHLESLWEPWMNWTNYGPWSSHKRTWQIDHIMPQKLLPFSDFGDPNFFKCWALSNLQPLESKLNLSKGCR